MTIPLDLSIGVRYLSTIGEGDMQMRYQKNIIWDTHSAGWIVEHRWPGGRWETVGVYGTREAAMAVYNKL
jgi:hypothetical protein